MVAIDKERKITMTKIFAIYFRDLTPEAQTRLLETFKTSEKNENWDMNMVPIAVIEREMKNPDP